MGPIPDPLRRHNGLAANKRCQERDAEHQTDHRGRRRPSRGAITGLSGGGGSGRGAAGSSFATIAFRGASRAESG